MENTMDKTDETVPAGCTPGPWTAVNVDEIVGPFFYYDGDNEQVFEPGWDIQGPRSLGNYESSAFYEADAKLMAAAPDLYAACRRLLMSASGHGDGPMTRDEREQLIRALAKAEGK